MSDQIESAAALMVRDYLILAFLVSLGALQISVSISGIRGLWLIPNCTVTRLIGVLLIATGVGFYIFSPLWIEGPWAAGSVVDGTSENRVWGTATLGEISAARNLNDIHGGMAGTAYAIFFVLSAILATCFAAAIGAINTRLASPPSRSEADAWSEAITQRVPEPTDGLDALKTTYPLTTFTSSLRNLRLTGANDIRNHLRSAHRWSIPSLIERMWRN